MRRARSWPGGTWRGGGRRWIRSFVRGRRSGAKARALRAEGFLDQSEAGCSEESGVVVEDDLDGNVFEEGAHASFVEECLHEGAIVHEGDDLAGDAGDVDSAGRH